MCSIKKIKLRASRTAVKVTIFDFQKCTIEVDESLKEFFTYLCDTRAMEQ